MLTKLLITAALLGFGPPAAQGDGGALEATQNIYQYATHHVKPAPAELERLLSALKRELGSPEGDVAEAYRRLAEEAEQPRPDGREIRHLARELYVELHQAQG